MKIEFAGLTLNNIIQKERSRRWSLDSNWEYGKQTDTTTARSKQRTEFKWHSSHSGSKLEQKTGRRHASAPEKSAKKACPQLFWAIFGKSRHMKPIENFVSKRFSEALQLNIPNWLHVRKDSLVIEEKVELPAQLQTVLEIIQLTHPGSAAMLDLCESWSRSIGRKNALAKAPNEEKI